MTDHEVAVLGGGIAGSLVACLLADSGHDVTIIEQRELLMDGASRWNDGKVHLGYTFTGTPSLATAALMQQGTAEFLPVLERVIGRRLDESLFGRPTVYVVDRQSMFDVETLWRRAQAVAALLARSAEALPGLRAFAGAGPLVERMDVEEASAATRQEEIAAAWRTTERHVSARAVAEHVRAAVSERRIQVVHQRVDHVTPGDASWHVTVDSGEVLTASVVVNCLWENRALVDQLAAPGSATALPVSIRYKRCLFGTNAGLGDITPSTRILGTFGDIACYGNGDAYLSWYPAGLAGRSDNGTPPPPPDDDGQAVIDETLRGLGLPRTVLDAPGAEWAVGGGYVVAFGAGDIDDPASALHTRDRPTAQLLRPGFVSVDTGKYTLGPLMARRAAEIVQQQLSRRRVPSLARRGL